MKTQPRFDVYCPVVRQLIECPFGQEDAILQANRHLVDVGLVQLMHMVGRQAKAQGNSVTAWIMDQMSQKVMAQLTGTHNPTQEFLKLLLEAVSNTPDPNWVYPLLMRYPEHLSPKLARILRKWGKTALPGLLKRNVPKAMQMAATLLNLGNLFKEFPHGDPQINAELAIACYQEALRVFTKSPYPEQWAMLQNNLGNVYHDLSQLADDPKPLLKAAIGCYQAALGIPRQSQENPMLHSNLGNVYYDLMPYAEQPQQTLAQAIASYQRALATMPLEFYPLERFKVAHNLGRVGFKQNLSDIAIEGYTTAIAALAEIDPESVHELEQDRFTVAVEEVYTHLTQVYINLGHYEQAIATVRSAQLPELVELMGTPDFYPQGIVPLEIRQALG